MFEMKSFRDFANKALTVEQAYDEEIVEEEDTSEDDDESWACSPQLSNTGN
jgi:hypothetical protein